MTPDSRRLLFRVLALIGLGLIGVWFLLVYIYFLRSNLGLIHNETQPLGIFGGLFGRYSFSMANSPPLGILQALVAAALTEVLGVLVLKSLRVELDRSSLLVLAFPIGFGISGIAFELLTMARCLYILPVFLLWSVLIGGFFWLSRHAGTDVFRRPVMDHDYAPDEPAGGPGSLSIPRRLFWMAAMILAGLITLTTFWHALFYPETYWDSLILYLGYGRMTFLEHGFPFKAEAQVGIGLGANYPHIFSTYGAMASTLFASWSDFPQRFICPVTGVLTCCLVYLTTWRTWRNHTVSAACVLLYRAIPYGIAYSTWASDYAFAILFVAAFLFVAAVYIRRPTFGHLVALTLIPAISMHLNYLMGILWVVWGFVVYATAAAWLYRRGFGAVLLGPMRSRHVWMAFVCGVLLASPWYVRNTVLTGNPVYAFFPEIFTASVRVNPEVLKSAELEWFRHGDGVGKVAETIHDLKTGQDRDVWSPDFARAATLGDRIDASFAFWVGFDVLRFRQDGRIDTGSWPDRLKRLLRVWEQEQGPAERIADDRVVYRWPHAWKMMPLFPGLFFVVLGAGAAALVFIFMRRGVEALACRERLLVPATAGFLAASLLGYMYLLADFYLYQIIPIIVAASVLGGLYLAALEHAGAARRFLLYPVYTIILLQGISPGLAFGLLNFKFINPTEVDGQFFSPSSLDGFRNPGMRPELFQRLAYGDDPLMWAWVNEHLEGERLLTHENRHYVYDPSITLVHLDDWDIQKGYGLDDPGAIYEFLEDQNIEYYLRIPKEANHAINRRLGMDKLEEADYLERLYEAGGNELFRLGKPHSVSP